MDALMKYIGRLNRVAAMHRCYQLEEEGLNGIQHSYILRICQQPGITQDQLATLLYVHKSNVARQLSLLEAEGFITRVPKEGDRRALQIFPTEKAHEVFPRVRQVLEEWNHYLLEDFPAEKKEELMGMLGHILQKAVERVERESAGREDT